MKKFVITRITAADVGNLHSVKIASNGENIVVTGQNGAGKSTLAKMILWALNGSTADGEKLIPIDGNGLPFAEVELTDGTTFSKFRKEMVQKVARGVISRTTDCFLNDLPVTQRDFQEYFTRYVPLEMFDVLLRLGYFFKLKTADQRRILTELFGNVTDEDVKNSDVELSKLNLGGKTAEEYSLEIKQRLKQVKAKNVGIPKAITELERQIVEVKDDRGTVEVELVALETECHEVERQIFLADELRRDFQGVKNQAGLATGEYWHFVDEYEKLKKSIASDEQEVEKLRKEYATPSDTCPICGQRVNAEQIEKIREKIVRDGKKLAEKIKDDKAKLANLLELGKAARLNMDALNKKVSEQNFDSASYDAAIKKRGILRNEISSRREHIAKIDVQLVLNKQSAERIEELKAQEKEFGKKIAEMEGVLALIEKLTLKKMEMVTEKINSQFEYVKFKMFENLKNGEVKNTCTATLDGVPYENLSKGEKFKAALDVLNAFQKCFGIMFPLIIDDAESYTAKSFMEIPNQQIMLKVVEGAGLEISCGKAEGKKIA